MAGMAAREFRAIQFASDRIRGDRDSMARIVEQDGRALQFATDDLRNDYGLAFIAVCSTGRALQFASAELQANRALVLAAMGQDRSALSYASKELREDRDIWLYNGNMPDWATELEQLRAEVAEGKRKLEQCEREKEAIEARDASEATGTSALLADTTLELLT